MEGKKAQLQKGLNWLEAGMSDAERLLYRSTASLVEEIRKTQSTVL